MKRKYNPRNISEFKEGDIITRIEQVDGDSSYIKEKLIYRGRDKEGRIIAEVYFFKDSENPIKYLIPFDKGDNIRKWYEGWDYFNPEDDVKEKEKKGKHKSTLKNTNLTAFLRGSK